MDKRLVAQQDRFIRNLAKEKLREALEKVTPVIETLIQDQNLKRPLYNAVMEQLEEIKRCEQRQQWSVIDYCREEVSRQGHDVTESDGIIRVSWMLHAWDYALIYTEPPSVQQAIRLGRFIEPEKNESGLRLVEVRVGFRLCPPPDVVPTLLERLFEHGRELAPLDFYREFETIHPFVDGNGRAGKVLLNWLNGTLLVSDISAE